MATATSEVQKSGGREILLHMGALEQIARLSSKHAGLVAGTIARISIIKSVHQSVTEEAVFAHHLLSAEAAEVIFGSFKHRFRFFERQPDRTDPISALFQETRFAETGDDHRAGQAIVSNREWVYDTCGYGPWLDLSTDQASAACMFGDTRTPNELLALKQQGASLGNVTMIGKDTPLRYVGKSGSDLGQGDGVPIADETLRSATTQAVISLAREAMDCFTTINNEMYQSSPLVADVTTAAMGRVFSQQVAKPVVLLP